jgi:hypothetical protein
VASCFVISPKKPAVSHLSPYFVSQLFAKGSSATFSAKYVRPRPLGAFALRAVSETDSLQKTFEGWGGGILKKEKK